MADIAKALKDEISRISRKEAKSKFTPLKNSQLTLKKTVADLQKRISLLERENKRSVAAKEKGKEVSPREPSGEVSKARLTSKNISTIRNKLNLSQAEFAKLVGVTPHAVYLWENKGGPLRLRERTLAALLSIKNMGSKEAKEKLRELGNRG